MAWPPRSVASSDDNPPPSLPIGVRAEPRITVLGISCMVCAMHVSATTADPIATDADTIAIGIFDGKGVPHDREGAPLAALLDAGEARSTFGHLALAHAAGRRWLLVGMGARDEFDAERARSVAATAFGRVRELGAESLCWELPHKVE